MEARHLVGDELKRAQEAVILWHYSHSVPSGKTHAFRVEDAVVMFSIPANKNLERFVGAGKLWELSRLWAPDGHAPNLLTVAISSAVRAFRAIERDAEILVSYADPNVGHRGGIYRAASWVYDGQSEEGRYYRNMADGQVVSRRAFHSGRRALCKREILALGYEEIKKPGKHRFLFPVTRRARRAIKLRRAGDGPVREG